MKKLAILFNPKSGTGHAEADIEAAFKGAGADISFYNITKDTPSLRKDAQDAAFDALVAAGGDGTINAAAGIALDLSLPLGVLPMGTLNHFAKDAGLPQDIVEAAQIICSGTLRRIDYCSVNGRIFLNNSSIGLYPTVVEHREKLENKISKWPAAAFATLRTLAKVRTHKLILKAGKDSAKLNTPLCFVGNNAYEYTKFGLAGRKSIDQGKMFVCVVRARNAASILKAALNFLLGRQFQPDVLTLQTSDKTTFEIKEKRVNVSLDGEIKSLETPLVYEMHHLGLTILS